MRIKEIVISEKDLARIDLIAIISLALRLPPERVLAQPERVVDKAEASRIGRLIGERRRGRPLSYLTRRREFFSETFYVDERVLIPRPETELLVEEAMRIIGQKKHTRVLDMGTGCGVVGILLAKSVHRVLCVDISPDTLEVAKKNARLHGVRGRCAFAASDLFSALKKRPAFDLVCANLPYVSASDWESLADDVKGFEPRQAIVGGKVGTDLYERCLEEVPDHLAEGGRVLFEIGGEAQADYLGGAMRKAGFAVEALRDLSGQMRLLRGSWKSSS